VRKEFKNMMERNKVGRRMKLRTTKVEMREIWRAILRLRDGEIRNGGLKTVMEKNIMKDEMSKRRMG
jgi:hypothetical protein